MNKGTRQKIWAITTALAIIAASSILFRPSLAAVWAAAQPHPRPFIELNFEDTAHVPPHLNSDGALQFAFVLTNHGLPAGEYHYQIITDANGSQHTIEDSTLWLVPGAQTVHRVTLAVTGSEKQRVIVALPEAHQQIYFWLGAAQ